MTCEDFKNLLIDRFDTNVSTKLPSEAQAHIANCPSCRRYYQEMIDTANLLQLRHSPVHTTQASSHRSFKRFYKIGRQAVAAILIFLCGVGVGLSHLFSTRAQATQPGNPFLDQQIKNLGNVGNYTVTFQVRSAPDETFSDFDPTADFTTMTLQAIHRNDSSFWRVEKSGGRTVVFNGTEQFMWYADGKIKIRGPQEAHFVDEWIHPERLLQKQASVIPHSHQAETEWHTTDSTVLISTQGVQEDRPQHSRRYRIESVFSKATGLPVQLQLWLEHDQRMILVLRSTEIRYNQALNTTDITHLPDAPDADCWQSLQEPPVESARRLRALRRETATQAAQRVMDALLSNRPAQAREALYAYQSVLPQLQEHLKGCAATDFSRPTHKEGYPGVYVYYRLTLPDGSTKQAYLILRRDNPQGIWTVDGGL